MLLGMIVGIILGAVTAFPLLLWSVLGGYLEGLGISFGLAVVIELAFGGAVIVAVYRWAYSGMNRLMAEIPI